MNSKFIKTLLSGLILTVSCGMFSPTVADEVPAKLTMEKDIKIAEGHCMLMVSLRLGDGFEPTVTDRREGMNSVLKTRIQVKNCHSYVNSLWKTAIIILPNSRL